MFSEALFSMFSTFSTPSSFTPQKQRKLVKIPICLEEILRMIWEHPKSFELFSVDLHLASTFDLSKLLFSKLSSLSRTGHNILKYSEGTCARHITSTAEMFRLEMYEISTSCVSLISRKKNIVQV